MTTITTLPLLLTQLSLTLKTMPFYAERFAMPVLSTMDKGRSSDSAASMQMDDHIRSFLLANLRKLPAVGISEIWEALNDHLLTRARHCPVPAELFEAIANSVIQAGWCHAGKKTIGPAEWARLRILTLRACPEKIGQADSFEGFVDRLLLTAQRYAGSGPADSAALVSVLTNPNVELLGLPVVVTNDMPVPAASPRRDFKAAAQAFLQE